MRVDRSICDGSPVIVDACRCLYHITAYILCVRNTERAMLLMTENTVVHQLPSRAAPHGHALINAGPAPRILIADDDPNIRQLLSLVLGMDGFDVVAATDGLDLVRKSQECHPALILVDIGMPRMDGFEAIRWMRGNNRTAHIPIVILTARSGVKDVVSGFETGADDYILKPFDPKELVARVRSHLRRSAQRPVLSPLTGLPGGVLLSQEIQHRLAAQEPLALLYADLDNFKAYNDTYGFTQGDQAILLVADTLRSAVAAHGSGNDFIGHIGGDDFAIVTTPACVDRLCQTIIAQFDQAIGTLYNDEDQARGYITGADRYGILRRFGLMSISIGAVTTQRRMFRDEEALTRTAAEMKHYAKEQSGSSYAVDQRGTVQPAWAERRRPKDRLILIVSADRSLRLVVRATLEESGYTVQESTDLASAQAALNQQPAPAALIADAQIGPSLGQIYDTLATQATQPPLIVLTYTGIDPAQVPTIAATWLHLPLPLGDIVAHVDQLT